MYRGLYTAGSAMITNTKVIDVVSNNMANANTVTYKKDLILTESFEDTLIRRIKGTDQYKSLNNGKVQVEKEENYINIKVTDGLLKTRTLYGDSYGRSAKITVDPEGYLSTYYKDAHGNLFTDEGYRLQGKSGPIKVAGDDYTIKENGDVLVGEEVVDNILMPVGRNVIGTTTSGVKVDRLVTDFSQGQLKTTNNELDFALQGKGFFKIETPLGMQYTRDGRFKIDNKRELVTTEGFNVMGLEGKIKIPDEATGISTNRLGEIVIDGETVDKFALVDLENEYDLEKIGGGFYKMQKGIEPVELEFEGSVIQGSVEETNVVSMREMIELLTSYRSYEANQKVVKAYDETLSKGANEIGRM